MINELVTSVWMGITTFLWGTRIFFVFFFSDISNERRTRIICCWNRNQTSRIKTECRGMQYFQRLFLIDNEKAFQMRREGKEITKKFQVALSCAKSITIIVGLLQGIKNPLARRASEVLKNISEQTGRVVNRWKKYAFYLLYLLKLKQRV